MVLIFGTLFNESWKDRLFFKYGTIRGKLFKMNNYPIKYGDVSNFELKNKFHQKNVSKQLFKQDLKKR